MSEQVKPETDQNKQANNSTEKTEAPKPAGARPAGARPAGARPAGARPAGARPAGARPAGARPAGARPAGAAPTAEGALAGAHSHSKPQDSDQLKFIISKFYATYLIHWNGKQDQCDICRNQLSDPCMSCQTNEDNEACPVAEGVCGHMFHLHCINKWTKNQPTCPKCESKWELKSQLQI